MGVTGLSNKKLYPGWAGPEDFDKFQFSSYVNPVKGNEEMSRHIYNENKFKKDIETIQKADWKLQPDEIKEFYETVKSLAETDLMYGKLIESLDHRESDLVKSEYKKVYFNFDTKICKQFRYEMKSSIR